MENLIISKDKRIPYGLGKTDYQLWSLDQFVEEANSDEGIEYTGTIYINTDSINQEVYNALKATGYDLVFYQYEDQKVSLNFKIEEGIDLLVQKKSTPPQPDPEPEPVVTQQPARPQVQPQVQPKPEPVVTKAPEVSKPTIYVADTTGTKINQKQIDEKRYDVLLNPYADLPQKAKEGNARVILFGSSKGGTGKTFTCLLTAYRYAQTHPNERIALADFDIIDGQVGITINKIAPTLLDYYKQYRAGNKDFQFLENCYVKSDHFSPNLDFYLAPPMDIPEVTNDNEFWTEVFRLLIVNYDTVFFDSGIDYLGKPPISMLYKIADKILLTCNTSINSVKSIIKQITTLSGARQNAVFFPEHKIASKINLILTRVSPTAEINQQVIKHLAKYAPIIAAFGNLDDPISRTQWYGEWEIWDSNQEIIEYLDRIAE